MAPPQEELAFTPSPEGRAPRGRATQNGGPAEGGGGQGGQARGDFTFAIQSTGVNVPYNGINHVDVAITRVAGFDGAVEVAVQAPPPGLVAAPSAPSSRRSAPSRRS
ncbi:hypothetical protein [Sorangium sp. So ce1182]|uniref:hypothetical protein n=1 Tax=Sorangium sp. So ce1182 TaxID=3133334 RepID=UPI003F6402DF